MSPSMGGDLRELFLISSARSTGGTEVLSIYAIRLASDEAAESFLSGTKKADLPTASIDFWEPITPKGNDVGYPAVDTLDDAIGLIREFSKENHARFGQRTPIYLARDGNPPRPVVRPKPGMQSGAPEAGH